MPVLWWPTRVNYLPDWSWLHGYKLVYRFLYVHSSLYWTFSDRTSDYRHLLMLFHSPSRTQECFSKGKGTLGLYTNQYPHYHPCRWASYAEDNTIWSSSKAMIRMIRLVGQLKANCRPWEACEFLYRSVTSSKGIFIDRLKTTFNFLV